MTIDIRGSGESYIVTVNGVPVGKPTNSYEKACIRANVEERRSREFTRPCMCCRRPFVAQGRFNRLCDPCKASANEGICI
jgi:hypothetical protein